MRTDRSSPRPLRTSRALHALARKTVRLSRYLSPALISLAVLALVATACGGSATTSSTAGNEPPPKPLTAYASILDSNSLIARIVGKLDTPGDVYVEYWNDEAGRFRSKTVASDGTNYTIHAVRLRPAATYTFQVFGTSGNGDISEGPLSRFTTGELPEALQKATFDVLKGSPTHDLTYLEFGGKDGLLAFDGEGNENEDLALDQKSLHIDGLAYRQDDPDDYNIYILHSPDNRAEMVHKMNPANGDTMFVTILEPEGGGTPGGAFMTNQFDHQFWAFMSIANDPDDDRIDIWQIVSDSPWFALDPAQGEVEAEASLDINLAFNSQDLAAGIWEGELVFTHNASEEEAILPVMLFVEDGDLSFRHLSLRIGWNLVSVNLQPDNHEDVPGLMSPLVERDLLIVMKNSDGEFYHPGYGFNNIPGWFVDEGYLILMSGEGLLTLRGVPVPPDLAIQLEEGWQIVSYYPRHQIEATVALSGIVDHLIIAKDGRGNFYLPDWEFSNMGNMREGQGYYLNVDVDCELVYQTGEDRIMGSADIPARLLINDLDWIDELNRSSTSFSLLLLTEDLEPGARLEAYTPSGVLAGRGIVGDDGRCGMALWGNDTIISGWVNHSCQQNYGERRHSCRRPYEILFNNGDQPVIKILGGAGVPARQVKLEWLDGEDAGWTAEGWGVARLVANEIVPVEFGIVSVFPNPFNSRTLIEYSLPEPAHTNLAVYDLTGRQVSLIKNDNQRAGVHTVVFNGSNLASGVYMVCLEVGGSKSQWKVALVK